MVDTEGLTARVTLELITGGAEQLFAGQVGTALYFEGNGGADIVSLDRNGSKNCPAI